jgi:hypothetical protein
MVSSVLYVTNRSPVIVWKIFSWICYMSQLETGLLAVTGLRRRASSRIASKNAKIVWRCRRLTVVSRTAEFSHSQCLYPVPNTSTPTADSLGKGGPIILARKSDVSDLGSGEPISQHHARVTCQNDPRNASVSIAKNSALPQTNDRPISGHKVKKS